MLDDIRLLPAGAAAAAVFRRVRAETDALAAPLSEADACVQSMPDASPAKWHLAHTTWFFETFLLRPRMPGYAPFHPAFGYLFNSYYEAVGARHPRPERGMLTRPSLDVVRAYRAAIDLAMGDLLDRSDPDDAALAALVALGCAHEQQHQELLLTDLLDLFARNPMEPVYRERPAIPTAAARPIGWTPLPDGEVEIGWTGRGFAFDCEGPRHPVRLHGGAIADRPTTNGEYAAFMADGGYARPEFWLADGWAAVQAAGWTRPAHWRESPDGGWDEYDLHGRAPLNAHAPVRHLSFFEADAYARWSGARLPREAEWEHAAAEAIDDADRARRSSALLAPQVAADGDAQWFGGCWEWTASAFAPYPGYQPPVGAVGEYNGKFMSGQMVLRGGSALTTPGHSRPTYRNFFYPQQRWQMTGLRLARES